MSEIYILLLLFHGSRIDTDNCSKMRALQKPIRYTSHHFKERTAAPPVRCRIETITTFHV